MKIIKIISYICYRYFAKYMPESSSPYSFGSRKIRFLCVKGMLKNIGENVNIEHGATFSTSIEIGDNSGLGVNCYINDKVYIGADVLMGPEVHIYTFNHKFESIDIPIRLQGNTEEKPVTIGDDVWIGSRVTILPGITVGNGSVIAAGSIVTKDVEPFTIVAGNPAKKIKSRLKDI